MADWKVSVEQVELLPHPNADALDIIKAGGRQFVSKKGLYKDGQFVIVVPEKSLLPDHLAEPFKNYLRPGNRVGIAKLRGEISEGILLPLSELSQDYLDDSDHLTEGLNIAEKLNVKKFEPTIPLHLQATTIAQKLIYFKHDCEQLSINEQLLDLSKSVLVTEKIHGSLISLTYCNGEVEVTSKGMGAKSLVLEESSGNFYWQAIKNSNLIEIVSDFALFKTDVIQVIGEAVPCQKGFDYGFKEPTVLVYKIILNGKTLDYDQIPDSFKRLFVPVLYQGRYDPIRIKALAAGNTALNANHIKEGIVVSQGNTCLKFISDAYAKKQTGEEFN